MSASLPYSGADIRKAGYESAADLVADVAANFTAVHRGDRGRLILVRQNGRERAAIVELRPAEDGAHWTVTTAGLFRPEYLARKELLWHQPGPAGAPPQGGSSFNPKSQSSRQRLDQGAPPGNAPTGAALPQDARAAVEIGADFRRIILGARSDKTSFMHESAHVFLWLLRELGTDADASPKIRQDWETIRDFLGAADPRDEPGGRARSADEGAARDVRPGLRALLGGGQGAGAVFYAVKLTVKQFRSGGAALSIDGVEKLYKFYDASLEKRMPAADGVGGKPAADASSPAAPKTAPLEGAASIGPGDTIILRDLLRGIKGADGQLLAQVVGEGAPPRASPRRRSSHPSSRASSSGCCRSTTRSRRNGARHARLP